MGSPSGASGVSVDVEQRIRKVIRSASGRRSQVAKETTDRGNHLPPISNIDIIGERGGRNSNPRFHSKRVFSVQVVSMTHLISLSGMALPAEGVAYYGAT